ncbi:TPA: hypothetical protein SL812_003317 [Pseudomonas aeruginosa]|uniref:hypothetical protein n=1 Tax=Pseudomonas aeruginosa TaxID=287 RepID=UPI000BB95DAE|nr:hypothetical protein [Pseudomonas aeruginosa]PCA96281.1 hypothetical protein CJT98_28525 [Pseudomonas aeruginosa]HEJ6002023.1 hypothetical protein [Pseudomonas aeruginosa]
MRVGHEAPVNGTAARVIKKGEHFDSRKKYGAVCVDLPLAMRAPTEGEMTTSGFIDLRGVKFGRFTVLGMSAKKAARWVVRCECGNWSLRTSRSIKNPNNAEDCCEECRHLLFLKREEIKRRTGKWADWSEIA